MTFNVWRTLRRPKELEEPPIPEATRAGTVIDEGYELPLWEVELQSLKDLVELVAREGEDIALCPPDEDHPHFQLVLP